MAAKLFSVMKLSSLQAILLAGMALCFATLFITCQPNVKAPLTIVVQALRENKRPIGYAPWPDPEPVKKPKKRKRT